MLNIRRSVFETNSSSIHSICIAHNKPCDICIPENLHFTLGIFDKNTAILSNTFDKASYLYTAICLFIEIGYIKSSAINRLYNLICKYVTDCTFDNYREYKAYIDYYIDHYTDGELYTFVVCMLRSEKRLINYLFSSSSFVAINSDSHPIHWYTGERYYKSLPNEKWQVYVKGC